MDLKLGLLLCPQEKKFVTFEKSLDQYMKERVGGYETNRELRESYTNPEIYVYYSSRYKKQTFKMIGPSVEKKLC